MNRETELKINFIDKLLQLVFDCIPEYDYNEWAVYQYPIEDIYINTIYYILDSLEIERRIIVEKFEISYNDLETILYRTYYNINLDTKYKEFYNKVKAHLKENNIFII